MHAAVLAPEDKSSFTRVIEFLTSFACWEQTRTQFAQPMHLSARDLPGRRLSLLLWPGIPVRTNNRPCTFLLLFLQAVLSLFRSYKMISSACRMAGTCFSNHRSDQSAEVRPLPNPGSGAAPGCVCAARVPEIIARADNNAKTEREPAREDFMSDAPCRGLTVTTSFSFSLTTIPQSVLARKNNHPRSIAPLMKRNPRDHCITGRRQQSRICPRHGPAARLYLCGPRFRFRRPAASLGLQRDRCIIAGPSVGAIRHRFVKRWINRENAVEARNLKDLVNRIADCGDGKLSAGLLHLFGNHDQNAQAKAADVDDLLEIKYNPIFALIHQCQQLFLNKRRAMCSRHPVFHTILLTSHCPSYPLLSASESPSANCCGQSGRRSIFGFNPGAILRR